MKDVETAFLQAGLAVTEQDLFFKQPLLNPSFDESNLNKQPAVNSGASSESAEPALLDEMPLSKEYIMAEIDMLVSQGRGHTDTQNHTISNDRWWIRQKTV